jgi:AAA domain
MSEKFRVRQVRLIAADRSYTWDFVGGVNLVIGPVGVGKTSLLELIRWGLGGSALLSHAVKQVGRQLSLVVDVGDEQLMLLRGIHRKKNRIAVHRPDGTPITEVEVSKPSEANSISHLIMQGLGIPEVRVPRSRRKPTGPYSTVSFNDVYGYMYLNQSEIDRSTVNHLDSIRDPKRRSTFELLYGLIDADIAQMQVELGQLAEKIEAAKSSVAEIAGFVDGLNLPQEEVLAARLRATEGQLALRERQLQEVRSEMRGATDASRSAHQEAEMLSEQLSDAIARRERAASQHEDLDRLRAQVVLDEQRTVRGMLAGTELAAFEFRSCPRCLQQLEGRDTPGATCLLCGQQEPETIAKVTLEDEVERLRGQLTETEALVEGAAQEWTQAVEEVERLDQAATAARARVDTEAREAVAPFVDRVGHLSEELGALRGKHESDEQALHLHEDLSKRRDSLEKLVRSQASLGDRLESKRNEQNVGQQHLEELSVIFDEILRDFQVPWYETAEIDRQTYLPIVGGKGLEELSSGGMKVFVNDAYFLAGLTFALRAPTDTYLPPFMVIDSPKKNFGAGSDDRGAADRFYRWLRRLQDQYGKSSFQLIVADNDVPEPGKEFPITSFTYQDPLIDDLPHPGPDQVKPLS